MKIFALAALAILVQACIPSQKLKLSNPALPAIQNTSGDTVLSIGSQNISSLSLKYWTTEQRSGCPGKPAITPSIQYTLVGSAVTKTANDPQNCDNQIKTAIISLTKEQMEELKNISAETKLEQCTAKPENCIGEVGGWDLTLVLNDGKSIKADNCLCSDGYIHKNSIPMTDFFSKLKPN